MTRPKIYLGDSVYAELDPGGLMIWLYTDNGYGPKNRIALEPEVYEALAAFVARLKADGLWR